MPCPLHLAKGKGPMPFLGLSCLGERTQLKTKARCLVFCIMPKAKARCLSLVKSRQITRLPRVPCFLAGGRSQCKGKGAMPFLADHAWVPEPQLKTKARCLVFCIMPKAKARCLSLVKSRQSPAYPGCRASWLAGGRSQCLLPGGSSVTRDESPHQRAPVDSGRHQ